MPVERPELSEKDDGFEEDDEEERIRLLQSLQAAKEERMDDSEDETVKGKEAWYRNF